MLQIRQQHLKNFLLSDVDGIYCDHIVIYDRNTYHFICTMNTLGGSTSYFSFYCNHSLLVFSPSLPKHLCVIRINDSPFVIGHLEKNFFLLNK